MNDYPRPPFSEQKQEPPGRTNAMRPKPDHGETSYRGSGKLRGRNAVITGGDSGIGRAVAIAFAREGANVLIAYLSEEDDAQETKRLVEEAGCTAILMSGDLASAAHCRAVVAKAVEELGGIDILVNNAAHQATFKSIEDISDEEWELTFKINIHAMFYLTKAAVRHMRTGGAIINTALHQRRCTESDPARLRHHQRGYPKFHGGLGAVARRKGHSGERRCARSHLDAANPFDDAGRCGHQVR
jgi:hypothetical protein